MLWFLELQRTIRDLGGDETFESTLFRVKIDTQFLLVLVYVDDLLIASNDVEGGENFLRALQKIWKIKRTGSIPSGKTGLLEFLGRTIYRLQDAEECLYFGVSRSYMEGIFVSWEEKLKESTGSAMPKLEELLKDAEKKFGTSELSATEAQRYRRVLGQLAWAALSRADLAFPVGFLSRFQSKPHVPAEVCLRSFLRWLKGHLHFVQQMPASSPPVLTEEGVVVGFCDASWNVTSVSGAVISWRGCCLKCFSRRQEVPALSSAEAEAIAIAEASKELVALGMLIETARDGIPLDEIGMPAASQDHRKHEVAFIQRWESGYFHFYHGGFTSTCEAHGTASALCEVPPSTTSLDLGTLGRCFQPVRRSYEKLQAHRDVAEPLQCCRTCIWFGRG